MGSALYYAFSGSFLECAQPGTTGDYNVQGELLVFTHEHTRNAFCKVKSPIYDRYPRPIERCDIREYFRGMTQLEYEQHIEHLHKYCTIKD